MESCMLKINYCVIKIATWGFSRKECFGGLEAYEFSVGCPELDEQGLLSRIWNSIITLLSFCVIFASSPELGQNFPVLSEMRGKKLGKRFACWYSVIEKESLKDPGSWLGLLLHFLILLL